MNTEIIDLSESQVEEPENALDLYVSTAYADEKYQVYYS